MLLVTVYPAIDMSSYNRKQHPAALSIAGMQGQLWCETVRTSEQLDGMIFPRLVALAERAWHKASWEDLEDFDTERGLDWERFANMLGYHQLSRLGDIGISYHLRPPGAQ